MLFVLGAAILVGPAWPQDSAERRIAAAAPANKNWAVELKQKLAQEAVTRLLNNQLPLKLDANAVFPTMASLPGDAFRPVRLALTAEMMSEPLPPGDYVIPALAFCSEYSVHCPSAGVAYQVAPIQGKAAGAISALLWRGVLEKHRWPHDLQAVSWAIQAGLTYAKMPKNYQAIIDDVIPDLRGQLAGDFFQDLQELYEARAKEAGLPPLPTLLRKLGKAGELALTADRQRQALLRKNTTDQMRDQVLFAGQERRLAPVKAEEGPWTVKVPGVAYIRYRVVGGNMRSNNEIQIRVLPSTAPRLVEQTEQTAPRVMFAAYPFEKRGQIAAAAAPAGGAGPSLKDLVGDGIGYSVSRAAQVLYFVPAATNPAPSSTTIGRITRLKGTATVTRNGETKTLTNQDQLQMNDKLSVGPDSGLMVTFADQTQFTFSQNTTLTLDTYVYDPTHPDNNSAHYSWLAGAFQYVSGLIAKEPERSTVDTIFGYCGIRGTEFTARYLENPARAEILLISGAVSVSPRETSTSSIFSAPSRIEFDATSARAVPLTRQEYDGGRPQMLVR